MNPDVKRALQGKVSGLLKSMAAKRVKSKLAPVAPEEDMSEEVEAPAEELAEGAEVEAAEGEGSGITDEEREMLERLYSKLA